MNNKVFKIMPRKSQNDFAFTSKIGNREITANFIVKPDQMDNGSMNWGSQDFRLD